jgi:hypothetical protein
VRPRIEVEQRRIPVTPNLHVVAGAGTGWNTRVRKIRERHEQRRALLLDRVDLQLELPDLLRTRLVGGEDRRCIQPLPLGARDLVARRILLALQPFHLRDQSPPAHFERGKLLEIHVRVEAAAAQRSANGFELIAHVRGIEHGLNPISEQSRLP